MNWCGTGRLRREYANRDRDLRKQILKERLKLLRTNELRRILYYEGAMVHDSCNYDEEKKRYCPLAVAFGLPEKFQNNGTIPTNEKVTEEILYYGRQRFGQDFKLNPTRGVPGEFYRTRRDEELKELIHEIFDEL